jgi:hypothetical protein
MRPMRTYRGFNVSTDPLEPLTLDGTGDLELRARYRDVQAEERPRLFEPAPAPMPGQTDLFDPDQPTTGATAPERG